MRITAFCRSRVRTREKKSLSYVWHYYRLVLVPPGFASKLFWSASLKGLNSAKKAVEKPNLYREMFESKFG